MSPKPPLILIFILSSLLSTLSTTIASHDHPKPTPNFIRSSCLATQYPSLCYQTLSIFGTKIGQSQRQLTLTALALSLSKARSTAQFVARAKKLKGIKHKDLEAVKDCIDTMSDGVHQLKRSFGELVNSKHTNGVDFMWHMSNVQSWVSAALTDESTCVDGLSDEMSGKVKGVIQMRVNSVAQVTSNALALVNTFVSRNNVINP